MNDFECISCGVDILVPYEEFDFISHCPACDAPFVAEYDYTLTDESEELPFISLRKAQPMDFITIKTNIKSRLG